ncbi:olfactory receptor 142-like [Megalops cyprinoides]|uniref:olfactory receptor 142-like n=1 Tax=Megalops cyprinoides TaxID=118141 RepID=UPI00186443F6|nr:olfactory receptor 142-like [Megalops cyprinoides]
MENVSTVATFILTAFHEMEDLKYLYFFIFLSIYIVTLSFNFILIGVICAERSLHEPMYIFVCSLACNGLYGSTALFPPTLRFLLSSTYEISLIFCLIQIFALHTTGTVEFTILAVMGYDRYVAICHPLDYHNRMSPAKVHKLTVLSWAFPFVGLALYLILTIRLTFCGRHMPKVYCVNFELVKLSCHDTSINSIVGFLTMIVFMFPQIVMIMFSYAQILYVCLRSSKESRIKALQTCTPHVLAVINFSVGCFFEIIQSRLNMNHVSHKLRTFMSLYFVIFPPLLNPVVYGVSIQAIRVQIIRSFIGKMCKLQAMKNKIGTFCHKHWDSLAMLKKS